jgi:hypothetical protein
MCNTKEGMMWESGSQFVYRRSQGVVFRSRNNGSETHLSGNPQAKNLVSME